MNMALEGDMLQERYELAIERIREVTGEHTVPAPFDAFFARTAEFILLMDTVRAGLHARQNEKQTGEMLREQNRRMYEDILPENYEHSYANPQYAVRNLGETHGRTLSFLYAQIRGLIGYVFEDCLEETVIHMELFLEIYNRFEADPVPGYREIREILYWFVSDYCDVLVTERIRQSVDPEPGLAVRIVTESDLTDLRYLYRYGEYITDNEIRLATYLNSLDAEKIERIARTYTEGYRTGFVKAGKDLSRKQTVNLRYHVGFERVIRRALEMFSDMGLRPVIFRPAMSVVNKRGAVRIGYEGAWANQQYEYDHREDAALYLDRRFMDRRLSVMQKAYETYKDQANGHAGPALIETFGEKPFVPAACPEALSLSDKQQKILVEMNNAAARLTNRYIIGEERSFTIIAFPVPEIGERFAEIFDAVLEVNTLDAGLYERVQQVLIDALDKGRSAHIRGRNGNRTDLTVSFADLRDPGRESLFENCVADVNIPVGEVFTSPKLAGTDGLLHVTHVYLNGLLFKDLSITFRDGMITDYSCGNFEDAQEGKDYVRANVLMHHESLPMGEFAIGTNTTAYVMAEKFGIGALLPILIAEKTGPHFAVGDTCYSWEEDVPVFNPDGKEIIARENAVSALRREDPGKAYFGCHTDITIPYSELGSIEILDGAGNAVPVLENGRFVLTGTELLNEPLDRAGEDF